MKKLTSVMFILLVLLICSSTVMAEDTKGIYVGILGGYVMQQDADGNFLTIAGSHVFSNSDYDVKTKNGYLLGAKVGWLTPFTKRIIAVEMEYNHLKSDLDTTRNLLSPGLISDIEGTVNMDMVMINVLARYPNGIFHPYIGAGIGYALINVDDHVVSMYGSPVFTLGGGRENNVFAYQIMAGFDVDVTKNIIVSVAYKYIDPNKISYGSHIDGAGVGYYQEELDFKSQVLTLGISYLF